MEGGKDDARKIGWMDEKVEPACQNFKEKSNMIANDIKREKW